MTISLLNDPTQPKLLQVALANQWISLPEEAKKQIKPSLVATLSTAASDVGHTAALVIAKVAAIEIPHGTWPDLIPTLLNNASQTSSPSLRHSTLESLGYICEELGAFEEDYLAPEQVNSILTAVVAGLREDEPSSEIRLASMVALTNALEFSQANFQNDGERNYIMQMVCQGTLAGDVKVRRAAWECLVRIAEAYYVKLPQYMNDIFNLTQHAVRGGDEEQVALQALEFWSTIAEEEDHRLSLLDENHSDADADSLKSHDFIKSALPQLVPLLLEQLTKQEEGSDGDEGAWNVALAAGTALGLAAVVVGDPIVELVMPYIQENIQRNSAEEDWRRREAATFAFGCILEGPHMERLMDLARAGLEFLFAALKDNNSQVKSTTAWAIGRIFQFVHGGAPLLGPENLPSVVNALLLSLKDEVHTAEKVCYAISQLAAGFEGKDPSPLSPYFKDIIAALLETAARPTIDVGEAARLQTQAFEAVNDVVRASSLDAASFVAQLIPVIVAKLQEAVLAPAVSADAVEHAVEMQGLLCGVIQVTVSKLTRDDATKQLASSQADSIMETLLRVFAYRPGTVHEEAMMAVGSVTYACGRSFAKYMDAFFPVLERGIRQYDDIQACEITLGVLGDICRAIEEDIFPYCDSIMVTLMQNLQSAAVDKKIKPLLVGAFGDIALAVGDRFVVYLGHTVPMLLAAAGMAVEQGKTAKEDEELADAVTALRLNILEAWDGILNGLSKPKADECLKPYGQSILDFVEAVVTDRLIHAEDDEALVRRAIDVIGDVASNLSDMGPVISSKGFIAPFLTQCAQEYGLSTSVQWTMQALNAVGR